MSVDNRSYHYYLIFGENRHGKEPWLENEWVNNFEPLFDEVIGISPYKKDTGLRVLEYVKKNETDKYYKVYKTGKLSWNKKSNEKWTLKADDKRVFAHFAAWTPRWTICDKIKKMPDIYFSFSNESYSGLEKSLQFDTMVTIAISKEFGKLNDEIIEKLSKKFNSKRTVYVEKSWFSGKIDENNKWSLKDWIDCMSSRNGIYMETKKLRSLSMHIIEFDKIEFEPYWEIIY
jgi:hypothetical protein